MPLKKFVSTFLFCVTKDNRFSIAFTCSRGALSSSPCPFGMVHQNPHLWNGSLAQRGWQLSMEGPVLLLGDLDQVTLQDFLCQALLEKPVKGGCLTFLQPVQFFLSGGLPTKPWSARSTCIAISALAPSLPLSPGTVFERRAPTT